MNVFSRLTQTFLNAFADYTMLKDVGKRITDVEELIASSEKDKEVMRDIANQPTAQMSLLTQLYENFVQYRYDVNKYEPLKTNYFVMAMIDTLSYDILAVDPRTNLTFDITVDKRYATPRPTRPTSS